MGDRTWDSDMDKIMRRMVEDTIALGIILN
jgi:hypothetical protein